MTLSSPLYPCKRRFAHAPFSLQEQLTVWSYRVAGYALLNLGEDAALIALMFC